MRPLEILLLVLIGTDLLSQILDRKIEFQGLPLIPSLTIITSTLQITLEGYRWQLVPAYLLAISFFLLAIVRRRREPESKKGTNWTFKGLALLAFAVAIGLPVLLPVPRLNAPDGSYPVGTTTLELVDTKRVDPYAPEPDQPRRTLLQIWYPAEGAPGLHHAPWMEAAEIVAPAVANWINLPSFFLDHLALSRSPALQDARVYPASDRYPIVLFSHGYGGFRAQNTNQAIYLASHGFIVAAVEHTYGAVVTVFPDGEVAYHNPDTLPDGLSELEDLAATRRLGDQWAGDLAYALDTLTSLDQGGEGDLFTNRLDLENIGVMGHSTGGGAAIEFCQHDPRCASVLTMDPYLKPVSEQTLETGLAVPALHLFSERWSSGENQQAFSRFATQAANNTWTGSIAGTAHYDFTDLPLLTPLASMIGLKGPIPGPRVVEIINAYTLAFFDFTLKGQASALIPGLSTPYVELILKNIP